jgi:hypothetical protein
MNNDFERKWNETAMTQFDGLSLHLPQRAEWAMSSLSQDSRPLWQSLGPDLRTHLYSAEKRRSVKWRLNNECSTIGRVVHTVISEYSDTEAGIIQIILDNCIMGIIII